MAKGVLKNVRLFTGGCDLTGQSNKLELGGEFEKKDVTNFGSPMDAGGNMWSEVMAGLGSAKVTAGGQWSAGDASQVDDAAWVGLGGAGPWTACPIAATVGSVAYLVNGLQGDYQFLGQVGDVAPWQASVNSTWPLVRGTILHPPGTARTATGNGTGVQQGAVLAAQTVYAALHVLSVSGTTPSMTVKIQSDDNAGFASPTDRITFTAATAQGGQIMRLAGPVTDDYWRATWTISGTAPSFLFVVSLGISN